MKLEGRIWKSRTTGFWLAEVRDLDLVTQGRSRKDAAVMLADAVESLVHHDDFRVIVKIGRRGATCSVASNDDVRLAALMLRRLRARSARSRSGRRRAA